MDIEKEDKLFNSVIKPLKQKRVDNVICEFKPEMLDYTLGNKSSLRLQYIESIEDENKRIEEMAIFLKEVMAQPFPDEFYPWIARDCLGLKYKRWEIVDMKRKYKIKKKRELKKIKQNEVKVHNRKRNKRNNKNKSSLIKTNSPDNPFVLTF